MSAIDNRIVNMQLKNTRFMGGIKKTLSALQDLKDGLKFSKAKDAFSDIEAEANKFSLRGIQDALDQINEKFSVFGAIAGAVIWRVVNAAIDAGKQIANALWDPLVEGGKKRALNIEQAKFQFKGLGMDVETSMADALYAVKGTAFGLDEAAVAASQFGASGVQSGEEMKNALRGISGVAAMAGSSYTDMANVFTKVAGQGRVMGDDLNRLGTRGINAAAVLADYLNEIGEGANLTEADIREMVTRGEIDFKTFSKAMSETFGEHATKANETYTGSLSNMRAALSRIGAAFFTPRYEAFRRVFNALTPVIDDVADALGPLLDYFERFHQVSANAIVRFLEGLDLSWLKVILQPVVQIIDNIVRSVMNLGRIAGDAFKSIFPPVSGQRIFEIVSAIRDLTNHLFIMGPTADKVKRIFAGFFAIFGIAWEVIKAVAVALADVFGELFNGSGVVLDATANFGDFLVSILETIRAGDGLSNFFGGIGDKIKTVIRVVKDLAGALGTGLADFFRSLDWGGFADGFGDFADNLGELGGRIRPLELLGKMLRGLFDILTGNLDKLWSFGVGIGRFFTGLFGGLMSVLGDVFSGMDYNLILDSINTGLLGGLFLIVKQFLGSLTGAIEAAGEDLDGQLGFIDTIKESFGTLTETLKTMQTSLKVATLMMIAAAVAILTGSLIALASVDSEDMAKGLLGITAMMGQLVGAMALLNGVNVTQGIITMPMIAFGMILLSVAVNSLASAVKKLADLDWDELARGLVGTTALLGGIVAVSKGLAGHAGGLITAGLGMIGLAIGVRILASAVGSLAEHDWEDLAKGLVGVGALIGSLTLFTRLSKLDKMGVLVGAGLILLGVGIKILASAAGDFADRDWNSIGKGLVGIGGLLALIAGFTLATGGGKALLGTGAALIVIGHALGMFADSIKDLGGMSWNDIGRGLTVLAGGLAILTAAMYGMQGALLGAAAMIVVAKAIEILAPPLKDLGDMEWDEIGRGLVMLAGSLAILAVAMYAMSGTMLGAAALVVIAAGLRLLTPALIALSELSWGELLIALVALAGALTIIGVAGLLLTPVVPTLLLLGIAVGLLGVGMLAAGAGVLLFATGLAALGAALVAFTGGLVASVGIILGAIPMILEVFSEVLTGVLNVIIENAPLIIEAMVTILSGMLNAIEVLIPDFVSLLGVLIDELYALLIEKGPTLKAGIVFGIGLMLAAFEETRPDLIQAGWDFLLDFLEGIENNIDEVVDTVGDIVIKFIEGMGDKAEEIAQAGWDALIDFLEGMEESARDNAHRATTAGLGIGKALIQGVLDGIKEMAPQVNPKVAGIARGAVATFKWWIGMRSPAREFIKIGKAMDEGLIVGLEKNSDKVDDASKNVARSTIDSMRKSLTGVSDILDREIDLNPQIRPELDVSEITKGAKDISKLLSDRTQITPAHDRAQRIGEAFRNSLTVQDPLESDENRTPVTFIQNNNSPKALNETEIYRRTRNQLSEILLEVEI